MANKGRDWERFHWRDMKGEYSIFQANWIPRYVAYTAMGHTGSIPTWMNAHGPIVGELFRDFPNPVMFWDWDFTVPGVGITNWHVTVSYDCDARTCTLDSGVSWAGVGSASMSKVFNLATESFHYWLNHNWNFMWDTKSTSDAAKFQPVDGSGAWRSTARGYPWPP